MKNGILFVLGGLLFMVLPGLTVWYITGSGSRSTQESGETIAERNEAIDDAFGSKRSSEQNPTSDEATPLAAEAADDDAEREISASDRKKIEALIISMGKAARDADDATLASLFSVTEIVNTAEENGLIKLPRGKGRAEFLKGAQIGWRRGIGQWSEAMRFDEYDIRRIDSIGKDRAVIYVRLWDDQFQIYTKMRWWAFRTKSKGWKFYDYEDFDTNLRVSTMIGAAFAGAMDAEPWMLELMEGLQLAHSFSMSLAEPDMVDGAVEVEQFFQDFLQHQLPPEIECFSRIILCSAIIAQARFEDGLTELQLLEDASGSNNTPVLHYMRGSCLAELDRHEEALASYDKYIDFLGADGDVLGLVAYSQLALGDRDAAIESAQRGLEDSPYAIDCFGSLAAALPNDRLGELDAYAEKTKSPQEAWEMGIDYALVSPDYAKAAAIFAIYREKFPESEWLDHYGESEDLASGIDVTKWTLHDWLTDENVQEKIDDHYTRRERFSAHLGELDAGQIKQLVGFLATAKQPYTARYLIDAQGERAQAALITALDDPRFVQPYRAETYQGSGKFEERYPVVALIQMLQAELPGQCKPALVKLMSNEATEVRAQAAGMLAAFGDTSHVDEITKALLDPEQEVGSHVLSGLQRAKREENLQPELRKAVTPLIAERIRSGEECHSEIWALDHIDEKLALKVLREPEVLRVDHPSLSTILWTLNRAEATIDESILEKFLRVHLETADQPAEGTEPDAEYIEYPSADVFEASLILLSERNAEAAKSWALKTIAHPLVVVRNAAADTLLNIAGLNDFDRDDLSTESSNSKVVDLIDSDNLLFWIMEEIGEDGFYYYFTMNEPDDITATVSVLDQIGATQCRDLLQKAIDRVSPDGLPSDSEELATLLEELTDKDENAFSELNEEWSKDPDQLYVLRVQRLLKNRELLIDDATKLGFLDDEN